MTDQASGREKTVEPHRHAGARLAGAVANGRESGTIARPLRVLVPLIQEELRAGDRSGLEHYRRAGEMLWEARSQVYRWGAWLSKNFELSDRTARRYMRLAQLAEDGAAMHGRTLIEAIGEPLPDAARRIGAWRPIREFTAHGNTDWLTQERQSEAREATLVKELAHQLIDVGYRALASKLHLDRGGSTEAMVRLNKVRNLLKSRRISG